MKKNTALLDCVNKLITFNFNDEIFTVDIKEGDLHDSWNSITDKNGVIWDFNFTWEDSKYDPKPHLTIYGLHEPNEDGSLSTNWDESTTIKIGKADKDTFFKEERFRYIFDATSPITCRVYNDKDEEVFKSKSFNKSCDELYLRNLSGVKHYMILTDKNNATKLIS